MAKIRTGQNTKKHELEKVQKNISIADKARNKLKSTTDLTKYTLINSRVEQDNQAKAAVAVMKLEMQNQHLTLIHM